ncbi:hypothetical protein MMC30_008468 [Trapelia coarctata]|nr:hypothetical protein [Trapelia coarctata]
MVAPAKTPTPARMRPTTASSKRSRSPEKVPSRISSPVLEPLKEPDNRDDPSLPAFLRQSNTEIQAKFEEIGWQQQMRIASARTNKDSSSPWAQDTSKEARLRNRYADIWPWANSRVRLKVPQGESDYINASPILLCCSKTSDERRYIATQGPKELGLAHFWQMIWHETNQVAVIVMLTQLAEGLREKCFQYYPDDPEDDPINVQMIDEAGEQYEGTVELAETTYEEASKTTVRKLILKCGEESKTVWHLLFLGWPDYGIPENEDRVALLELIRLSQSKNEAMSHPRIVHCSAGVGRSGTFIALEHLLEELEAGGLDDVDDSEDTIYNTVSSLREQRMMMVQSEMQYQLLYDLLREQYRKRHLAKMPAATGKAEGEGLATEKLPASGGEPSPKVMRLSRSIKAVLLRERSTSRHGTAKDGSSNEGKAPVTPSP